MFSPAPPLAGRDCKKCLEVVSKWRSKVQFIATAVRKRYRLRMQEQPAEPQFLRFSIRVVIAVAFVADDRMLRVVKVNTYLVRPAGERRALQQAVGTIGSRQRDAGLCRFAMIAADNNMALAILAILHIKRRIDQLLAQLPVADHQRHIVFFDEPVPEPLMKLP